MSNNNYDVNKAIDNFFANHTSDKSTAKNHTVKYCGCGCNGNYNQHKENHAAIYAPRIFGDIS